MNEWSFFDRNDYNYRGTAGFNLLYFNSLIWSLIEEKIQKFWDFEYNCFNLSSGNVFISLGYVIQNCDIK